LLAGLDVDVAVFRGLKFSAQELVLILCNHVNPKIEGFVGLRDCCLDLKAF
jgi:hypothetical protein